MTLFEDERGQNVFHFKTAPFAVAQSFTSHNKQGVLRGFHRSPYAKYITCLSGSIFDVVIQPNWQSFKSYSLKAGASLLIPPNHAHGFYCLEPSSLTYCLAGEFDAALDINVHWDDPHLAIPWPLLPGEPIVSAKDTANSFLKPIDTVVLGGTGYLGGELLRHVPNSIAPMLRLEDPISLRKVLTFLRPKHLICAAGISGKPTIDWCETHAEETLFANVTGQLNVMHVCKELGIHLTIIGSGGVFGDGVFTEEDKPNLMTKVYSRLRILLEQMLPYYPEVLYLRVLYPLTGTGHDKCFLTKLKTRLASLHDTRVSVTVIPSLFPKIQTLLDAKLGGIYNFVNQGQVSLTGILDTFGVGGYNVVPFDGSRGSCELVTDKLSRHVPVQNVEAALCAIAAST
jgi:3,5-epimerase/4-reductase